MEEVQDQFENVGNITLVVQGYDFSFSRSTTGKICWIFGREKCMLATFHVS